MLALARSPAALTSRGPQLQAPGPHAQATAHHLRFHLGAPGPRPPPARPEPARRPAASVAAARATREAEQPAAENASERDAQSRARKRRAGGRAGRSGLPQQSRWTPVTWVIVGDSPAPRPKTTQEHETPEAVSKSPDTRHGCFLFSSSPKERGSKQGTVSISLKFATVLRC